MRISDWSSDVCSSDLWVLPVLSALDSSIHLIGNVLIECADDVAAVESYFVATFRARTPHGWTDTIRNGRYLDDFRRLTRRTAIERSMRDIDSTQAQRVGEVWVQKGNLRCGRSQ